MSVRRGTRAPPAARPGTLCGPAITLATPGRHGYASSLSGLSPTRAPKPTAMHPFEKRAEQVDGQNKSEDEILREAYEYLLLRAKAKAAGTDDENDYEPIYSSGFKVYFRGAHIDTDWWETMERKAEEQAEREAGAVGHA